MFKEPRTLEQMINYSTAYAVDIYWDCEKVARIAFTPRKTKQILIDLSRTNEAARKFIDQLTDEELDSPMQYSKTSGLTVGRYRIAFGDTEREIRSEIDRNTN